MKIPGHKIIKGNFGNAELAFSFYKPLKGKAKFTVCELATYSDTKVNGQKISELISDGMNGLHVEMAEANYLGDTLGGKTPAQAIKWLVALYDVKRNKKSVSTMRGIHNERGLRFPRPDTDEQFDATMNYGPLFESAYQKIKKEQGKKKFSIDDGEHKLSEIQQQLRCDKTSSYVSIEEVPRLFHRAGLEAWKRLFQMAPEEAAQDIFNAQKDKRNGRRRQQVPYIITDMLETLIDHPYRHAMGTIIGNSGTSARFRGTASVGVNRWFYHYPQRFLDGITPALHPLGPMLLRLPSFVKILQKLYGGSPSDVVGRDFILACYAATKVYAAVSEFDNNDIKMKQKKKTLKSVDPKILEETLSAHQFSDGEEK